MPHINIEPTSRGKVRDLYDLGDTLLFVASDRISAFDYILPDEIPYKGEILTRISLFWFEYLQDITENHLVSTDVDDLPEQFAPYKDYLAGRFMLVKKASMYPVECIVRGYLTGSGYKEYLTSQSICGIELASGLEESARIVPTIYTPSTKAEIGDHDMNVSLDYTAQLIGRDAAEQLRDTSIAVYEAACAHAAECGIIIADTKFEFGTIDGKLVLADEVLTPDSSRFWPADDYEVGRSQKSFDKQYVRDWLSANWDMQGQPPHLPKEVIAKTTEKYITAYERICGTSFVPAREG